MNNLNEARQVIHEVDKAMAELFELRMHAARQIAAYKKEHGLPIYDEQREAQVIKANSGYIKNPAFVPYFMDFTQDMMNVSKRYQSMLVNGMRVAYCGIQGAFAQIAAQRIFPAGQLVTFKSFEDAYRAVESGDCDCAVLPIENSYQGEVGQVIDLMFNGELVVNGVYELPIRQHLMGIKGAKAHGIKTVVSHPQALGQCEGFLRQRGYDLVKASNTATAAKQVLDQGDPAWAAIASAETAEIYGLDIIEYDINRSNRNTTRFAVFCRAAADDMRGRDDCTSVILFTVKNEAGALARAINVIGEYGFNMKALRSRPMKQLPWNYYFYVEATGDIEGETGRLMMEELGKHCDMLKVAGWYHDTPKSLQTGKERSE